MIATQQISDVVDQLSGLGFNEFYSAKELIDNFSINNHSYAISKPFMKTRLEIYKKAMKFISIKKKLI